MKALAIKQRYDEIVRQIEALEEEQYALMKQADHRLHIVVSVDSEDCAVGSYIENHTKDSTSIFFINKIDDGMFLEGYMVISDDLDDLKRFAQNVIAASEEVAVRTAAHISLPSGDFSVYHSDKDIWVVESWETADDNTWLNESR